MFTAWLSFEKLDYIFNHIKLHVIKYHMYGIFYLELSCRTLNQRSRIRSIVALWSKFFIFNTGLQLVIYANAYGEKSNSIKIILMNMKFLLEGRKRLSIGSEKYSLYFVCFACLSLFICLHVCRSHASITFDEKKISQFISYHVFNSEKLTLYQH